MKKKEAAKKQSSQKAPPNHFAEIEKVEGNPDSKKNDLLVEVNGVCFKMLFVERKPYTTFPEYGEDRYKIEAFDVFIGENLVTEASWTAVMGEGQERRKGSCKPVTRVNSYDCEEFIKRISELTGIIFFMPWEKLWAKARSRLKNDGYHLEWCSDTISEEEFDPRYFQQSSLVRKQVLRCEGARVFADPYTRNNDYSFRIAMRIPKIRR